MEINLHHRRLLNASNDLDSIVEFDLKLIITGAVAFTLCFVLFMIILLSVMCYCSSGGDDDFIINRSEAYPAEASIKKRRHLRLLPPAVYEAGRDAAAGSECTICLEDLMDGETIRVLPGCAHPFHVGCIDTWLVSQPSCPICRISLLQ